MAQGRKATTVTVTPRSWVQCQLEGINYYVTIFFIFSLSKNSAESEERGVLTQSGFLCGIQREDDFRSL